MPASIHRMDSSTEAAAAWHRSEVAPILESAEPAASKRFRPLTSEAVTFIYRFQFWRYQIVMFIPSARVSEKLADRGGPMPKVSILSGSTVFLQ